MKTKKELESIFGGKAAFRDESWHSPGGRAIRELVFGFNDGLVSTLGFVAGVSGAMSDHRIVLIAGLAEILSGGVSMFFGGYLSTKNQREFFEREIEREKYEIENMPEHERDEIRGIYAAKGFKGPQLEMVVDHITSDKRVWLKCMMEEELGLIYQSMDNPYRVAVLTGASFMCGGVFPLVPFLFNGVTNAFPACITLSAVILFLVGIVKVHITKRNWLASGLESLGIGVLAAGIGYAFGKLATFFTGYSTGF